MRFLDAAAMEAALPWRPLVEALRAMFAQGCEMPVRHHHTVAVPDEPDATLLLMPAWVPGRYEGVKVANVFPGNAARGRPSISASYLLSDGRTGELLAILEGGMLTARRTAAASALAADYLARADARHLVLIGTGRVARNLFEAHAAVRPIERVTVWGRSADKAEALAAEARALGFEAAAAAPTAEGAQAAVGAADIVSCATLSDTPVVAGAWLPEGCHLDLVGGFRPHMRETDDDAIRRSRVFVDTRPGATKEAGDIAVPMESGVLSAEAIAGDLYDLARGAVSGRDSAAEITLFKSVGAALEDLAGAILAYEGPAGT
ncbi:MAG: ornithine cyclodeaminase family protein [Azospirillaceae bacterium]